MTILQRIHKSIAAPALALALSIACSAPAQAQAPMTIKAHADSTSLIQGDRVAVHLQVLKNMHEGALIDIPEKEKDYYGLEMGEITADSTDLGNGRIQLDYTLMLQAFDPAELLTLPPFRYATAGDTAYSDILTFKVYPVELSPELGNPEEPETLTIHPDEQPIKVTSRWYDYVPDWAIWVLLGIAAIALGIVLYLLYRKNGKALFPARKPTPPYELAKERLSSLRERHLLEQGQVKQYYTELIDIFRNYLEGRFSINAMEMPSKMILRKIRENKEIHLSAAQMEQVLQLADFVKFAAATPGPEEGLKTYNAINDFVDSTKPQPQPEETDKKQKH